MSASTVTTCSQLEFLRDSNWLIARRIIAIHFEISCQVNVGGRGIYDFGLLVDHELSLTELLIMEAPSPKGFELIPSKGLHGDYYDSNWL